MAVAELANGSCDWNGGRDPLTFAIGKVIHRLSGECIGDILETGEY